MALILLTLLGLCWGLQLSACSPLTTTGTSSQPTNPLLSYPTPFPIRVTLPRDFVLPPAVHDVSSVSGNFLLTAPKKAYPGRNFTIGFESFESEPMDIEIRVYAKTYINREAYNWNDYKQVDLVTAYGIFARGYPGLIHIPIPDNIMVYKDSYTRFYWEAAVVGGGMHTVIRTSSLQIMDYVPTAILIQTDKAIYKPGQIVNYRVLAADSDLKLYDGKFTVEIKDPNNNKMQYRKDVEGVSGVVEGAFQLADQPVYGNWDIHVTIEHASDTQSDNKGFTVTDYQLPRFEVQVDLPPFILHDDTTLHGTVKATYTFGQRVKGRVELHVTSGYSSNILQQSTFPIDGQAEFSFNMADLLRLSGYSYLSTLTVKATVREDVTGISLDGTSQVTVRNSNSYKLEILDNTPSVFKPGLPFSVFARGSHLDGSGIVGEVTSMTLNVVASYKILVEDTYLYGVDEFSGTYPLPTLTYTLPPSGVVQMQVDIPANATSLDVYVDFKGHSEHRQVQQVFSMSDNYLQVTLLDNNLKKGQTASFQARATEPMTSLRYQIISRGAIYDSKVIDTQGHHLVTFDVTMTPAMAPTAHLMAYYVRTDLEIVPDSIAFNIEDIFKNEVSLEMSATTAEPHDDLNVTVTADPGSLVHILAEDQSVLLLKSGNDISQQEVKSFVGSQVTAEKPTDSMYALSLSAKTALATLQGVGLQIVSNASLSASSKPRHHTPSTDPRIYGPEILPHYPSNGYMGETPTVYPGWYTGDTPTAYPPWYTGETPTAYPPWYMGETPTAYPPWYTGETPTAYPPWYTGEGPGISTGGSDQLQEVERIRTLFPETWLWLSTPIGANGSSTIHTTVPDTITSWTATAFATNNVTGLGITTTSTKLTVFRSFFVSLTMPSYVVRGEHTVIQATVFNYLSSDLSVLLSMPGSSDYTNIVIQPDNSESYTNNDVQQTVTVKSRQQGAVYFSIIPASLGDVDIEVSARSNLAADAVRRPLTVVAEGIPSEYSVPLFINLGANGEDRFTEQLQLTLPDDVVDGTTKMVVKVTGEILGSSIDGLETLLKMPTGCGEQNMLKLAPDLYISDYLNLTGQMSHTLQEKILHNIHIGYQRELTYQRRDGSFSAFGNSDSTGNTWLTAFVLRVFHQLRSVTYIGDSTLQRALLWLTQHQNQDGSFNEFGTIWDPALRNFHDHSPGLTSFVLFALLENSDIYSDRFSVNNVTILATTFLENNHHNISDDDYLSLAMTCLALTKAGSPEADIVFEKLWNKSSTEHGMRYWKVPTRPSRINVYSRWRPVHVRARPVDIQVTSYALLVLGSRGMIKEGIEVVHWLTRQRNPYGGFVSTQDTVVALQALTEFVHQAVVGGLNLNVDVRSPHTDVRFNVTTDNAIVMQTKEYDVIPTEVTVTATGSGIAIGEMDMFFNVETDLGDPAFDVSTTLMADTLNHIRIMICTRWLLEGESGMVIQEVGIPSGFEPDMKSIGNVAGIKRTEQKGRFVDVYFDMITKDSLCYSMMFDRNGKVAHSQPSYIITQDYYEPENRATVSYLPSSLRYSEICDVCSECCN